MHKFISLNYQVFDFYDSEMSFNLLHKNFRDVIYMQKVFRVFRQRRIVNKYSGILLFVFV